MRELVVLLVLVLIPSVVMPSPFLVCDPQAGVTHYYVTGASFIPSMVGAEPDGSIRVDVSNATVGQTPITVEACDMWSCSTPAPFVIVRNTATSPPKALKLSK